MATRYDISYRCLSHFWVKMESAYLCVILHVKHKKIVFIAVLTWFPLLFIFSPPLWISMFFFLRNSSSLFSITRSSFFSVIHVSVNIKKWRRQRDNFVVVFSFLKSSGRPCDYLPNKTVSFIWVAIPVDWVILHWYACGADGQSVGRSVGVRSRNYQIFSDG